MQGKRRAGLRWPTGSRAGDRGIRRQVQACTRLRGAIADAQPWCARPHAHLPVLLHAWPVPVPSALGAPCRVTTMRAFSSARRGRCSAPACRNAQQGRRHVAAGSAAVSRRSGLLAVGGAILTASSSTPALADGELATLTTLYGLASPPTSYGGYGGNSKEDFKYKFDYPEDWKRLTVNKVQKVCRAPANTRRTHDAGIAHGC